MSAKQDQRQSDSIVLLGHLQDAHAALARAGVTLDLSDFEAHELVSLAVASRLRHLRENVDELHQVIRESRRDADD